jgi:choline kinase
MLVRTAIILAAGRGSRMGSETFSKPKCLTSLGGRTLLEWQIGALRAAGIKRVVLIGGYSIESLFSYGDQLLENPDWEETNMVSTLACAHKILEKETCIVSYSDIVYHPKIIRDLQICRENIAVIYDRMWESLWRLRFNDPLSDAETFKVKNGWLTNIGQRTNDIQQIEGQYIGVFLLSPKGWSTILKHLNTLPNKIRKSTDVTALLQRLIRQHIKIVCYPTDGKWCEVDTQKDRDIYRKQLDNQVHSWAHDWRW